MISSAPLQTDAKLRVKLQSVEKASLSRASPRADREERSNRARYPFIELYKRRQFVIRTRINSSSSLSVSQDMFTAPQRRRGFGKVRE